jgi:nitrate/nitrite-specific signal transduction histidine kinase
MKIRSQLIVYFLVISLIPLILFGIFNYISAEQLLKKEILNILENIASLREKNIELEAFTPLENLKYVTIINGILVGILVIIASLIIGKSISNPIQKLVAASKNMSQEKFDNPISIIGGSEEIKELSNQLDNMRQNILYTNNHLNDLVDERTQKLEKAILELKDKEEALKDSNKNLLLVNEKLSLQSKSQMEFVNITAHELRTPIMPIITLTELLYSKIKKENKTQKKNPLKENEKNKNSLKSFLEIVTGYIELRKIY